MFRIDELDILNYGEDDKLLLSAATVQDTSGGITSVDVGLVGELWLGG